MPVDLSSYKVASAELSSATKFDNLVQAVQDDLNALPPAQIVGYPADATKFLRGDGSWSPSAVLYRAEASADLILTTTAQDIVGTTITADIVGTYVVFATFDFDVTTSGVGICIGQVATTGTLTSGPQALFSPASTERATTPVIAVVQITVVNQTIKLQASKSINAGAALAHSGHTTIRAIRMP